MERDTNKLPHTPGPWILSPLEHETLIHGSVPCVEVHRPSKDYGLDGEWICYVRGNTVYERRMNAKLIAAAPELLSSLLYITNILGPLKVDQESPESIAYHEALKAIKKATE